MSVYVSALPIYCTRVVGLPKPYTALMVSLPARPLTISSRFLSATFLDNPSWPFGLLMGHHTLPAKGSVIIFNREFCKSWTTSVEGHQRLQVRCKEGDDSIRESDPPSTSHLGDDLARRGSRPENERLTFKDVQFVDFSGRTNGRTVSELQEKQQKIEVRKLIRSHAMKTVHQRRRAQKESAEQSSTTKKEFTPFVDPDRVVDEEVAKLEAPAILKPLPHSLVFLGGFPLDLNVRSRELLTYCPSISATSSANQADARPDLQYHLFRVFSPIPQATRETARKAWFALALCDELLFRTLLFVASATFKSIGHACPLQEADSLARPIYALLRQRLSDVTAFSEATLGAVSCLVAAERLLGNHERQAAHQAGLVEMLRLKGGLGACSDAVRHKILRSDALLMRRCVDVSASPYRWISLQQKSET